MTTVAAAERIRETERAIEEVAPAFIDRVLTPYRLHCQYLKRAFVEFDGRRDWQTMTMKGEFAIAESCYIDDTGHFNAVEFNICYNQLAYVHLAYCIEHRLLPALAAFDADSFREKQLSHFLIANINSSYHAQVNPREFFGTMRVKSARPTLRFAILKTECEFHDAGDGRADGEVKLVVLNP
jgi:hypothetical protein